MQQQQQKTRTESHTTARQLTEQWLTAKSIMNKRRQRAAATADVYKEWEPEYKHIRV